MINPNQLCIVDLTEQEILNLNQLTLHPGFATILKVLEGEALRATAEAINFTEPDKDKRLVKLDDARSTHKVVGNLLRILTSYQVAGTPTVEQEVFTDPIFDVFRSELN